MMSRCRSQPIGNIIGNCFVGNAKCYGKFSVQQLLGMLAVIHFSQSHSASLLQRVLAFQMQSVDQLEQVFALVTLKGCVVMF